EAAAGGDTRQRRQLTVRSGSLEDADITALDDRRIVRRTGAARHVAAPGAVDDGALLLPRTAKRRLDADVDAREEEAIGEVARAAALDRAGNLVAGERQRHRLAARIT